MATACDWMAAGAHSNGERRGGLGGCAGEERSGVHPQQRADMGRGRQHRHVSFVRFMQMRLFTHLGGDFKVDVYIMWRELSLRGVIHFIR